MISIDILNRAIKADVTAALLEDVGSGDITASLIPLGTKVSARVISREQAVICGTGWVDEVFRQIDDQIRLNWKVQDSDSVTADQTLFTLEGEARSLLTAERCALNFLQTLSGTATACREYADLVTGTHVKLLDTRKTIPGLRIAQKYAVSCGGCHNHRIGLYDAFLIKENHIAACGSISQAVSKARDISPESPVEVEVETLDELEQALAAKADIIMLDNFSVADLEQSVKMTAGKAKLEASGGINKRTLAAIAETRVDYISIGALTKDCRAVDLSMRFE